MTHSVFRRDRSSVTAILALALATALSLAACGSSDGTTDDVDASASIPTQDVVSSVKRDDTIRQELPAEIQSSGTLTLGTPPQPGTSQLPHGGQVDGKDIGLDVDLRNAVAKVLGVQFTVEHGTFATILPGVENGKYQVGQANFGATKAREQVVDFSTYLNDGQGFLAASGVDLDKVTTITDACGYTIATTPGSTFQTLLSSQVSKCAELGKKPWTVQYFADTAPIFLGLANGKVDLYFGPTLSLKYDAKHIEGTKFLGEISSTPVGFVTAKGSPLAAALADAVNKLISTGDYAKIFDKWDVPDTKIDRSTVNPPTTF